MSGHIRGDVRKRLNHSVSHWNPATADLIDQARVEGIEQGRRELALELLHTFITHQPKDAA
jgi:hypothetical protein